MDQKKTLWIITASGVFLAVVILAALILNKPNASTVPSTASITTIEKPGAYQFEKDEFFGSSSDVAIEKNVIENLVPVDESAASNEIPGENLPVQTGSEAVAVQPSDEVTIDLNKVAAQNESSVTPKNQTAAVAIETKKNSETPSTIYTGSRAVKSDAEISAEKKAASLNSKSSASAPAVEQKKAAPVSAPETSQSVKYWVQCASYASKKSADGARSALDENRIPSEVFTYKDSKNMLYYRVRVGPYMTKSEAEYWKNRICQIEMFKNSQSYITMN